MDLSVVPYGKTGRSKWGLGEELRAAAKLAASAARVDGGGRYGECMRNHAAAIDGEAFDGCMEFMPGGEEGTLEVLKCTTYSCHRNFHHSDSFSSSDPCCPLLLKAALLSAFLPSTTAPNAATLPHDPPSTTAAPDAATLPSDPPSSATAIAAACGRKCDWAGPIGFGLGLGPGSSQSRA
ncbi:uncharacterized protein [Elaeis guineensis]|uniref:uncharacterized protein n=1 Tax=Elaeis guineensis var. tenera TaxID=51953 RepID=UPI003C6CFF2B